jgi:uncharacterized repeat protein (TIGR02543 family)
MFKETWEKVKTFAVNAAKKVKAFAIAKPIQAIIAGVLIVAVPLTTVLLIVNGGKGDEPISYVVTFDSIDGDRTYAAQSVKSGQKATNPGTPELVNHEFDGWYTEINGGRLWDFGNDAVTDNVNLYAHWTRLYNVAFNSNGGVETYDNQRVRSGERAANPGSPTLEGYEFVDWYTEIDGGTRWVFGVNTVTSDITIHARWTEEGSCIVDFDLGGGEASSAFAPQTITSGEKAEDPGEPTRAGYEFDGWYTAITDGTRWVFEVNTVTNSMTLYARWTPIAPTEYTVSFDVNGGEASFAFDPQTIASGEKAEDPGEPTRAGYEFDGWYTAITDGTRWVFEVNIVTDSMTLYARWTPVAQSGPKTVGFDLTGGVPASAFNAQEVEYGTTVDNPGTPRKNDCNFIGWYTHATDGVRWNFENAVTANMTLYARWQAGTSGLSYESIPDGLNVSIGSATMSSDIIIPSMHDDQDVIAIKSGGFQSSINIKKVTMPDSVTSIGYQAFAYCSKLALIDLSNNLTSIGGEAFYGCTELTSIVIPISVTSIGTTTFFNCSKLMMYAEVSESAQPNGWIGYWHYYDYSSSYPVVWSYAGLSDDAGLYYKAVDGGYEVYSGIATGAVEIPSTYNGQSVIAIGEYAFYKKANITSIDIPSSVESIGEYAFAHCSGLTSIVIPGSVTEIGEYAFFKCANLISVELSASLTEISDWAFTDCVKLTSIVIPNGVTSIGVSAFQSCTALTLVTLPDSVTDIGESAFAGCNQLSSINLPSSLNSIGSYAFRYCAFSTIVLPAGLKSIGAYAFSNCAITSIIIPDSVTSVGDSAFDYCMSLTTIYVEASEAYVTENWHADWNKKNFGLPNATHYAVTYDYPPAA